MSKKIMKYSPSSFKKGEEYLASIDPSFRKLMNDFPLTFKPAKKRPPYLSLIRSIAYQQIQIKAAETILARFYALYPEGHTPTPEEILNTPDEKIRAVGLSARKVKAIKDIAQKTIEGLVPTLDEVDHLTDEELVERLVPIYGIGKWSVEMLLIFQLGRLDVWPIDDFGTRKGWQLWKKKKEMPTLEEIERAGKKYSPYRSILSLYLWQVSNANTQSKKSKVITQS